MRSILAFLFPALLVLSCTKAGTGGKAKLNIHVIHESTGLVVSNAEVYIKYNATDAPGPNDSGYDAKQVADNSGKTVFEELRRGSYYLYAEGLDTATGTITKGGIAFDIRNKVGERDLVIETRP